MGLVGVGGTEEELAVGARRSVRAGRLWKALRCEGFGGCEGYVGCLGLRDT